MIVNYYPGGTVNRIGAPVKYTGTFFVKIDESNQSNWECHLLTSGNLTVTKDVNVDIFLVGGGGGGGSTISGNPSETRAFGGAGGVTNTIYDVSLLRSGNYAVTVGAGGSKGAISGSSGGNGEDSSFTDGGSMNYIAQGGEGGGGGSVRPKGGRSGGHGGYISGGGDSFYGAAQGEPWPNKTYPDQWNLNEKVSAFWEDGAEPYAGGGAGGGYLDYYGLNHFGDGSNRVVFGNIGGEGGGGASCHDGLPNTGGGGGGAYLTGISASEEYQAGNGGSGIIIIRNHRT